jgi:hypothetical protein
MSSKGVVRKGLDSHVGHASTTANPFHKTSYANAAQSKVYSDSALVIVSGGKTACGDPTASVSGKVFAEGKGIHRQGDSTGGHGSWVASKAETGSSKVFAS